MRAKKSVGWFLLAAMLSVGFTPAYADLSSALDGVYSNVTSPGYHNSKQSVGYTFGDVSVRIPTGNNNRVNLIYFDPPSISARGCGGFDMHMGSFRMIKLDQLINVFRQIVTSAMSAFFYSATCSVSPKLCDTMRTFQNITRSWDVSMAGSCKIGQNVGNMMFKTLSGESEVKQDQERTRAIDNAVATGAIEPANASATSFKDVLGIVDNFSNNAKTVLQKMGLQNGVIADKNAPTGGSSTDIATKKACLPDHPIWDAYGKSGVGPSLRDDLILNILGGEYEQVTGKTKGVMTVNGGVVDVVALLTDPGSYGDGVRSGTLYSCNQITTDSAYSCQGFFQKSITTDYPPGWTGVQDYVMKKFYGSTYNASLGVFDYGAYTDNWAKISDANRSAPNGQKTKAADGDGIVAKVLTGSIRDNSLTKADEMIMAMAGVELKQMMFDLKQNPSYLNEVTTHAVAMIVPALTIRLADDLMTDVRMVLNSHGNDCDRFSDLPERRLSNEKFTNAQKVAATIASYKKDYAITIEKKNSILKLTNSLRSRFSSGMPIAQIPGISVGNGN